MDVRFWQFGISFAHPQQTPDLRPGRTLIVELHESATGLGCVETMRVEGVIDPTANIRALADISGYSA